MSGEATLKMLRILLYGEKGQLGDCELRAHPSVTKALRRTHRSPGVLPFQLVTPEGVESQISIQEVFRRLSQDNLPPGFIPHSEDGKLREVRTLARHKEAEGGLCYGVGTVCEGCGEKLDENGEA